MRSEEHRPSLLPALICESILYIHRVRIDGFLSGHAFEPSQQASVIILVGLKCTTALLAAIIPGQTDEVLFRL